MSAFSRTLDWTRIACRRTPRFVIPLKLFIADDHPVLRAGLKVFLNAQPEMKVVGECGDGQAVVTNATACSADVALIDVVLPRLSGVKATERLLRECPTMKVLAFSAYEERGYVEQMLAAGATGYVLKRASPEVLVKAIRAVARGEKFFDPPLPSPAGEPHLSRREYTVLRGVARGLTMKEIAASLEVSVRSVETYRTRAMEKFGLRTRANVIRFAATRGWLTDE